MWYRDNEAKLQYKLVPPISDGDKFLNQQFTYNGNNGDGNCNQHLSP